LFFTWGIAADAVPNDSGKFPEAYRQHAALPFSKKLATHIGAIKYFICHYNLTVVQGTAETHHQIADALLPQTDTV
jgi:hypothetical protein